jgi:hypothetical protein
VVCVCVFVYAGEGQGPTCCEEVCAIGCVAKACRRARKLKVLQKLDPASPFCVYE